MGKGSHQSAVRVDNLLSEDHSRARDGRHRLVLEGYGYRWFRVGGLDYLLKRSDVETPPAHGRRPPAARNRR